MFAVRSYYQLPLFNSPKATIESLLESGGFLKKTGLVSPGYKIAELQNLRPHLIAVEITLVKKNS